jgi:hypothetical protein
MNRYRKKSLKGLALAIGGMMMLSVPALAAVADNSATKASIRFTAGELKLNSVPVLDFGTQNISHLEQNYPADSVAPVIEVSDLRGSGNGWELIVSLSPFNLEGSGTATLQAASIQLTNPVVTAANGTVGTPPTAIGNVVLTSDDQPVPVWKANLHEGMGVWNLQWNPADALLNVKPGTAQEGKSEASLNWSLQSAP